MVQTVKTCQGHTIKGTQSYTQTLDLCMLHDRLPSTNEQICGRRIMAITRASQARDVGSIPIARSTNFQQLL